MALFKVISLREMSRHLAAYLSVESIMSTYEACRQAKESMGDALVCRLRARSQQVLVAGGVNAEFEAVSSVEKYDPATSRWEPLAPMLRPRELAAAAVLAGRLYVVGGIDDAGPAYTSYTAERFDPEVNMWETLPGPLIGRYRAAAASMAGHLYLVGGKARGETLSSCERFDPRQCRWDAMRKPRKRGSVAGAVLMSPDDVVDGHKSADEHISTVDALVLSEARHHEVSAHTTIERSIHVRV